MALLCVSEKGGECVLPGGWGVGGVRNYVVVEALEDSFRRQEQSMKTMWPIRLLVEAGETHG